jgi:hypothetical protein
LTTRLAYRMSLLGVIAVAAVLSFPSGAVADRCFLLFQCPSEATAPPATPPPPSPAPMAPVGPPTPPPGGNSRCAPRGGPRGEFLGVGDAFVSTDERDRRCTLASMVASGIGIVRASFSWPAIEVSRGRFDFSYYDRYVGRLARYRLRVLPLLFGTPARYSAAPRARHPDRLQPRRRALFARFARALVRRYGPRGSYWRRHRGGPPLPIRSWQIWNEPNLSFFWAPRPSPRGYVRMLAAASRAIKRVDPRAEIVAGGLPESQFGTPVAPYVRGMYRAGAKRWFDTMALHPYHRTATGGIRAVARLRRLMDRHGDRLARIWVTEFGWPSGGPRHRFRVGRRAQASKIAATVRGLWLRRGRLRLRGAIYVMWRDLPPYRSDFWGLHLGLYKADGRPKPAAAAFRKTARSLRGRSRRAAAARVTSAGGSRTRRAPPSR